MAKHVNVEIRHNLLNKGRGLFAVRDVHQGDTIFEEQPLVCAQFLWNKTYKYSACDHCLRSLETAQDSSRRLTQNPTLELPEPECCETKIDEHTSCPECQVMYCSSDCREAALVQYHQCLCMGQSAGDDSHPVNRLADAWKQIHYPPETCSIMLLARMIATVKQAQDKEGVVHEFSKFCNMAVNEVEAISHKLMGDKFQDQCELFRSMFVEHMYDEHIQHWLTPEGFRSMFALIGRNGQGIASSSISRWVNNIEKLSTEGPRKNEIDSFIEQLYDDLDRVSGPFLDCEGSGLYSLQSTSNHSCVPNAEVTFPHNNCTLVMKALTDIPAGEEILISYLDDCALTRSRHSRQKELKENYLFVCSCTKCLSQVDDPDVTSEEEESMDEDEAED